MQLKIIRILAFIIVPATAADLTDKRPLARLGVLRSTIPSYTIIL
jgi:hypothetical protein